MGLSPDALYSAIFEDVKGITPFGPVALGGTPPDASYRQIAASQLLYSLRKKFIDTSTEADNVSRAKFFASNKTCKDWKLRYSNEHDRELVGEFQRELDRFFYPEGQFLIDSLSSLLDDARTGPGASVGARGNSYYAKFFSSPLTTTSMELYKLYSHYIEGNPRLVEAECYRRRAYGNPKIVDSSRCSFVPKTRDESRMICVEPSLNMYFQLGLGTVLERRLRSIGIDLSSQPSINRLLAHAGSKSGSFCTIDLSSASDSISLKMCKRFLPKELYYILVKLRSPATLIGGERTHLNMMSTMGNGFTFPLQTIIFSCLIRAVYRVLDLPLLNGRYYTWSCFGDDLVVLNKAFRSTCRLLDILGFSTNSKKTFFEGPFRESCGTDWFNGQPVRGVYIRSLTSKQDIMVAINLLNAWTGYTGIPLFNGVQYLVGELRGFAPLVPLDENIDAGIRCPSFLLPSRRFDRNGTFLYRAYRPVPVSYLVEDGAIRAPGRSKRLIFNPPGLISSFLFGELGSGRVGREISRIMVRHDHVHYRLKQLRSPNWDYVSDVSLTNGFKLTWQQWETAVLLNWSNPTRKSGKES